MDSEWNGAVISNAEGALHAGNSLLKRGMSNYKTFQNDVNTTF
jgi:hypothetical protein